MLLKALNESFENWQQSTEPNRKRMEKELTAIQDALENLEQTISSASKIISTRKVIHFFWITFFIFNSKFFAILTSLSFAFLL